MRTIRVELDAPVGDSASAFAAVFGGGCRVRVSTEVIVSDDKDAHRAGEDACHFVTEFITGYGQASTA